MENTQLLEFIKKIYDSGNKAIRDDKLKVEYESDFNNFLVDNTDTINELSNYTIFPASDKPSNCILGYVSTLVCPHCKSEDTDKVDGIWFCNNCTADNF